MLEELKQKVCKSNLDLVRLGLVLFTWGNVSACSWEDEMVVIKPSGIAYEHMTYEDMVVVDLKGNVVEGRYRPSSDTPTHIELYKAFKVGAVVHTHSKWATIWAQSGCGIPLLGTTHADNFCGDIPVTRQLANAEIDGAYEEQTGKVIVETFRKRDIDPNCISAVLVNSHGPFTWGDTPEKAVENSAVLEYIAEMAFFTKGINGVSKMKQELLEKHFNRKHGEGAYYGQRELV